MGLPTALLRALPEWTRYKVERPIRYIWKSVSRGRDFVSDADLNEQAERWLVGTRNVRRHGTTGERSRERLELDGWEARPAEADIGEFLLNSGPTQNTC